MPRHCSICHHERLERLSVEMEPDLPALPEPETSPERNGWLFDSRGRSYFERLASYHRHKKGAGNGHS